MNDHNFYIFSPYNSSKDLGTTHRIEKRLADLLKNSSSASKPNIIIAETCSNALEKLSTYNFLLNIIVRENNNYSEGIISACEGSFKPLKFNIILEQNQNQSFYYNSSGKSIHLDLSRFFYDHDLMNKILKSTLETPEVHISYGNNTRREEEDRCFSSRQVIDDIELSLGKVLPFTRLVYDKKLETSELVSGLEDSIIRSERIILIINKKYLESPYAMKELSKIITYNNDSHKDIRDRLSIITMHSGKCIYNPYEMSEIDEHWEEKLKNIEDKCLKRSSPSKSLLKQKQEIEGFIATIDKIPDLIADLYHQPFEEQSASGYLDVIWRLATKLDSDGYLNLYGSKERMGKSLYTIY